MNHGLQCTLFGLNFVFLTVTFFEISYFLKLKEIHVTLLWEENYKQLKFAALYILTGLSNRQGTG